MSKIFSPENRKRVLLYLTDEELDLLYKKKNYRNKNESHSWNVKEILLKELDLPGQPSSREARSISSIESQRRKKSKTT